MRASSIRLVRDCGANPDDHRDDDQSASRPPAMKDVRSNDTDEILSRFGDTIWKYGSVSHQAGHTAAVLPGRELLARPHPPTDRLISVLNLADRLPLVARAAGALRDRLRRRTLLMTAVDSMLPASSGPAMRSTVLKDLLAEHGVTRTHNQPRVSNDNPFSESEFRTMKYRPNYPGIFDTSSRPGSSLTCAPVPPESHAVRHCPVLTERDPRRQLGPPLAAA